MDDLDAILSDEIDGAPDGLPTLFKLTIVAEKIARNYTMSRGLENYFIRLGLINYLLDIAEDTEDAEGTQD
jgi:hypothetical protein